MQLFQCFQHHQDQSVEYSHLPVTVVTSKLWRLASVGASYQLLHLATTKFLWTLGQLISSIAQKPMILQNKPHSRADVPVQVCTRRMFNMPADALIQWVTFPSKGVRLRYLCTADSTAAARFCSMYS